MDRNEEQQAADMKSRAETVSRVFGIQEESFPCTVCGAPAEASLGFGTRCKEHAQ